MSVDKNLLRVLEIAKEVAATLSCPDVVEVSELRINNNYLELQPVYQKRGPSRYEVLAFTNGLKSAVKERLPDLQFTIFFTEKPSGICYTYITLG